MTLNKSSPSWQIMEMGEVGMQSWTLEVRDLLFPLKTCWVFFWRCEKSGFWRTTFASGKEVTANLLSPWQRIPLSCSGQDIVALLLVGGSMSLPELNPLPIKPPHIQRGLVKALAEPHTLFLLCVILLKGTHWKILKHPLHLYNQTPFIIQIRPERFAAVFFIFK